MANHLLLVKVIVNVWTTDNVLEKNVRKYISSLLYFALIWGFLTSASYLVMWDTW